MIKQLAIILILFSPLGLLPTSRPAFSLAEERKMHGAPRPPVLDDDEKFECKESPHCTFDEDTKILFELVTRLSSWNVSNTDLIKEAVQAAGDFKINRFFEAIDARDLQTISAIIYEDPEIMFNIDDRARYRDLSKHKVAQTLLSLYRQTLSSSATSLPNSLWTAMLGFSQTLAGIAADRQVDSVLLDEQTLAWGLTKDWPRHQNPLDERVKENNEYRTINTLMSHLNALKKIAISGDAEIVEVLLNALLAKIDVTDSMNKIVNSHFYIMQALNGVLDCSAIAESPKNCQLAASALFKSYHLPVDPCYKNYSAITKMLLRAAMHLAALIEPIRNLEYDDGIPRYPLTIKLKLLMSHAMRHGSTEILKIIAQEIAEIPLDSYHGVVNFEAAVWGTVNGQKLGTLLSINAHPYSLTNQFAMGMLSHVEKNPRLLARLKKYVRKCRKDQANICAHVSGHLLPVLAPIIAEYASPCMPTETEQYILALSPATDRNPGHHEPRNQEEEDPGDNDEQNLLGQYMASIMLRQPNGDQHD